MNTNELVGFLEGNWECHSFEIPIAGEKKTQTYPEKMTATSSDSLEITAYGDMDGKDMTREMKLEIHGETFIVTQGNFKAIGQKAGNVYSARGEDQGQVFQIRIYALGEKFVFQREIWRDGKVIQVDFSYLLRKP